MIIEIFLFVLSAVNLISSQKMMCTYSISTATYSLNKYQCNLFAYNPDGLNWQSSEGNHLTSYTNEGVLSVKAFDGLTKNIPSSICSQFPNVELLYFSNMKIEIMSIRNCNKVTMIRLSGNTIKELPSDLCKNQPLLSELDLRTNGIEVIPSDMLSSCTKLRILLINSNQISEISTALFANKPVLNLVAAGNNKLLTTIQDYNFKGADNLETLHIDNSAINTISPKAFSGLRKLKFLAISYNKLTTLHPEVFRDLVALTTLAMTHNPSLVTIPPNTFKPLISLEDLQLSNCGITTLQPKWFSTLTMLKKLYLSENGISEIPPGIFKNLSQIKQIDFAFNNLKRIDSKPFSVLGLQSLTSMVLKFNNINAVEKLLFDAPIMLDRLDFSVNVCASRNLFYFYKSKDINMEYFSICFRNYDATV